MGRYYECIWWGWDRAGTDVVELGHVKATGKREYHSETKVLDDRYLAILGQRSCKGLEKRREYENRLVRVQAERASGLRL